jgi:hypothetical protein
MGRGGELAMSGPISATMTSAARWSTPPMVSNSATLAAEGAISCWIRADSTAMVWSRSSMWARIWPTSSRDGRCGTGRPGPPPAPAAWSGAELLANAASTCGSWVPATRASSIARPETPMMSVATLESLIPASWRTLSSRWTSRVRSPVWVLR